jgi:hypothetical protein
MGRRCALVIARARRARGSGATGVGMPVRGLGAGIARGAALASAVARAGRSRFPRESIRTSGSGNQAGGSAGPASWLSSMVTKAPQQSQKMRIRSWPERGHVAPAPGCPQAGQVKLSSTCAMVSAERNDGG